MLHRFIDSISTLPGGETLFRTLQIISVAYENSHGERATCLKVQTREEVLDSRLNSQFLGEGVACKENRQLSTLSGAEAGKRDCLSSQNESFITTTAASHLATAI
ncbi:hypothetical protein E2C01_047302 [Portunus trituberculatus]|uniref:Uncharacterized protein n=1 Tax=Portunus trituberculatus TaxID=210409 RepID=A0A5B7G396_PORTR|nr:hypothetical protein [Portunus trituberculatus]